MRGCGALFRQQEWVYAVDITPAFVAFVSQRAREAGLSRLTQVLCRDNSVDLPPEAMEVALVCDTYHHFEYPDAALASLRSSLKPGGRLVVVDVIREPGTSRGTPTSRHR